MSTQEILKDIATISAAAFLVAIVFTIKFIKKGSDKIKDINRLRELELFKVYTIIQRVDRIDISSNLGKIESINFYLNADNINLFYSIEPDYLKYLVSQLEVLINQNMPENLSEIYRCKYVKRNFYIGNELIFSWKCDD